MCRENKGRKSCKTSYFLSNYFFFSFQINIRYHSSNKIDLFPFLLKSTLSSLMFSAYTHARDVFCLHPWKLPSFKEPWRAIHYFSCLLSRWFLVTLEEYWSFSPLNCLQKGRWNHCMPFIKILSIIVTEFYLHLSVLPFMAMFFFLQSWSSLHHIFN